MVRHAWVLLVLALAPAAALAQAPAPRLALEVSPHEKLFWRDHPASSSVARRVLTHVTPLLEGEGWQVIRVDDAGRAARSGKYHAAVRLDVHARTLVLVNDARLYRDEHGREVVANPSESTEAWGGFRVHDGLTGKTLVYGELPVVSPQVRDTGSTPTIDDEEAVARLLADAVMEAVVPGLRLTRAGRD